MRATNATLFRAARPLLKSSATRTAATRSTPFLSSTKVHFQNAFARQVARRFQTTEAAPAQVKKSLFQTLWDSPVGIKTVHFWAPIMKWALVVAGIADFARPAQSLSLTQNLALTATGAIWTRWCLIIKPRNILLAAVNFFLGCVGIIQVTRILTWRNTDEGKATLAAQKAAESAKATVESVKETAVEGVKAVTQ